MPVLEWPDLPAALPPDGRLLGLDIGEKTIGLALSDPALRVASPVGVIQRGRISADIAALDALVRERGVGGLVLGLPLDMHGGEGRRCQSVRQFQRNIAARGLDLPAAFWDERLSTVAVERLLIREADMNRRRRGAVVDKMAAALILQGALDAMAINTARRLQA